MAGRPESKVAIVIGGSRGVGPAFFTGLTPMLDDGQRPPEAKLQLQ